VSSIGSQAFADCTSLNCVKFLGTVGYVAPDAFLGDPTNVC
jgi:hypothetical protein